MGIKSGKLGQGEVVERDRYYGFTTSEAVQISLL